MNYAVEFGLGSTMYIPSFLKTSSGIQNVIVDTQTHRQEGDLVSLLLFF
jgi:hypothetical protein